MDETFNNIQKIEINEAIFKALVDMVYYMMLRASEYQSFTGLQRHIIVDYIADFCRKQYSNFDEKRFRDILDN